MYLVWEKEDLLKGPTILHIQLDKGHTTLSAHAQKRIVIMPSDVIMPDTVLNERYTHFYIFLKVYT
ncbi:hypothetical protein AB205_0011790 [Aquarana catesbeiana]|uniref:Uncharacterized protein n=1 Tax=Aquarana catesbeiana TaxID=8400 RepID=A0A2G9RD49_AQUCT|nr:hypothetical protein AB205_0011790 [Aquarana catesbeiana]